MARLLLESTPLVGSSRMTALEPPTNARAMLSLRCMPPDRFLTRVCRQWYRSTSFSNLNRQTLFDLHCAKMPYVASASVDQSGQKLQCHCKV
ncbi:hypothetical protein DPMN_036672 [Dreissena polymorpha]|uniref:Uncharacterized protein n=1 Tax=Dreissena polymorpha TaxID=45954 RepID=A0A9D4RP19_DREPO|nr:hypothetical protein DPMN_036672 [Dreissena polymorpha]